MWLRSRGTKWSVACCSYALLHGVALSKLYWLTGFAISLLSLKALLLLGEIVIYRYLLYKLLMLFTVLFKKIYTYILDKVYVL